MENNSQSRTLYLIQILTIVVLILILIMQALPFLGFSPLDGEKPQYYTAPKPGQSGSSTNPSQQASLLIPLLALEK